MQDGKVGLPPLHQSSELGRRLGVAVVGLGTLALENIIPAFGSARSMRLAAQVSGEPD